MGLGYNSKEIDESSNGERSPLRAGRYEFSVEEAAETTFASGNKGLKIKLLVGFDGRDVPCFDNLVYVPKALWKLRAFLEGFNLDFDNPPDAWELVKKRGLADFEVNEKGYFSVKSYCNPVEQTKHSIEHTYENKKANRPVQTMNESDGDNVPF